MLTENVARFIWKEEHQDSFDELKQALISSPILAFPKIEGEYILDIDASNQTKKVIAYFNPILNKSRKNYCATHREFLAILS